MHDRYPVAAAPSFLTVWGFQVPAFVFTSYGRKYLRTLNN